MSLDDLPSRDTNSELSTLAESNFKLAVAEIALFVVQKDGNDYGSDFQLEAKHDGSMTNYRVHVQLKGTMAKENRDGSVSVSVARTNLNYLVRQPNSIYVCYHEPTKRLLVRSAEDAYREIEHRSEDSESHKSLTLRFSTAFDRPFQSALHARTVAQLSTLRDDRLQWVTSEPVDFPEQVLANVPSIAVPNSEREAFEVLQTLFNQGHDAVISKAFGQFAASIGPKSPNLIYAYLSEINLAMRNCQFDRQRVRDAISLMDRIKQDPAGTLYCQANGYSALGELGQAKHFYRNALQTSGGSNPHLEAMCWKNLGTAIEQEGNQSEACDCYERAIEHEPHLMEAHMALAMAQVKAGQLEHALNHFDEVVWSADEISTLAARGHRLDVFFRLEMTDKAFDDISVLLPHGIKFPWIFPWCARLVYNYARTNGNSVVRAIRFWDAFVKLQPKDRPARKERLLCLAFAKMHEQQVGITYDQYFSQVSAYVAEDANDAAYLWDRVGHWAQVDKNWEKAEENYRKAYNLNPGRYGYCLGTALNFLGRYEEALPVLFEQAKVHQPNASSWFQVAVAQEKLGDFDGCKESYRQALELDPDQALAAFNLGGIYWNNGPKSEAITIWTEAISRFPSHPLAEKVRQMLPQFFGGGNDAAT